MSRAQRWPTLMLAMLCLLPGLSPAVQMADFERQLHQLEQGEQPPQMIGDADLRVAVFTYEDPDGTGLGDVLASLVAHQILLETQVQSLGVLIFTGGLAPRTGSTLGYFDKVDRVAAAQEVDLAVWGSVQVRGKELLVETFVQIPARTLERRLTVRVPLAADSEDALVAALRPDRIAVQRLRVPLESEAELMEAAGQARALRAAPRSDAPVQARLDVGEMFRVLDRSDGWVLLVGAESGTEGWVPLREHCRGACAPLLHAAGFAADLVRYLERRAVPEPTDTALTAEAQAVAAQIDALETLRRGRSPANVIEQTQLWTRAGDLAHGAQNTSPPPGGAAFANLQALARVMQARSTPAGMSREEARDIAFDLAKASQYDPRNQDVLHNLAVLFAHAGDGPRAALARSLLQPEP